MSRNRWTWILALACAVALLGAYAAAAADKDPIPGNNGFYVYDGGKLTELAKPTYKMVKQDKTDKEFFGFADDSPFWKTFTPNATLVLYDTRIKDPEKMHFQALRFEGERNVNGAKMKTSKAELNMWITGDDFPFKFRESNDKAGVWVFTPTRPIDPGRYVAYWGGTLEKAATDAKLPRVFIFEIK
jgi:hypothetical protein